MKSNIELKQALKILKKVFEAGNIDSCIIGAMVPHVQIAMRLNIPSRETNDIDYVVQVNSWEEFDKIKDELVRHGFRKTVKQHRLLFGKNCVIDIIPFGKGIIRPGGILVWPNEDSKMNMSCFEDIFKSSAEEKVYENIKWRIAPLPLFVISKFCSFNDRNLYKDLSDIAFCLEHYDEAVKTSRRFDEMANVSGLVWDYAGAFLLGKEAKPYLKETFKPIIFKILLKFESSESPIVEQIIRESGKIFVNDADREKIYRLFYWFEKGLKT